MSRGNASNPCLFSAISGVITLKGEPVNGAKIRRVVTRPHKADEKVDFTATDAFGHFEMPSVFDSIFIAKFFPLEFSVAQLIFVEYNGEELKIWDGIKAIPAENAESNGKPLVVTCELSSEDQRVRVGRGAIYSKCIWDVIPDKDDKLDASQLLVDDDDI